MALSLTQQFLIGSAIASAVPLGMYFGLKSRFAELEASIAEAHSGLTQSLDRTLDTSVALLAATGNLERSFSNFADEIDAMAQKPLLELCNNTYSYNAGWQDCEYVDAKDVLIEIEQDSTGAYLIKRAADFENGKLALPPHEMPPSPADRQIQNSFLLYRDMG